jgi:hypothetical protein
MRSAAKTSFYFALCLLAAGAGASRNYAIQPMQCQLLDCTDIHQPVTGNQYAGACGNVPQCTDCYLDNTVTWEACYPTSVGSCKYLQTKSFCFGECFETGNECCFPYPRCQ